MAAFSYFREFVKTFVEALLAFVYPPLCLVCKTHLAPDEQHVCTRCWRELPRLREKGEIPADLANRDGLSKLVSLWPFEDEVQKVIHDFKYAGMKSLGDQIGGEMAQLLLAEPEYVQSDLIVPVPLHKTRMRQRGYNQSTILSRAISQSIQVPVESKVLMRIRNTKSQANLNAEQRQRNVDGAFQTRAPEPVVGKTILLVDDVCTTGATLSGCARALLRAGAGRVLAATAAKTP